MKKVCVPVNVIEFIGDKKQSGNLRSIVTVKNILNDKVFDIWEDELNYEKIGLWQEMLYPNSISAIINPENLI